MHTTKLENTVLACTIESDEVAPFDDGNVRALLDHLRAFHTKVPLTKFDMVRDAVDLTKYAYSFDAADGRKWKQTIWLAAGVEADMDFNISDRWKQSEFILHRPVRDASISLCRAFQVQRIKCRW